LVDQLRRAEQQLASLRKQLAALRQQIARVEQQVAGDPQQIEQLANEQQTRQREIEKLARHLDRLQAADAGQSTRNAANRLSNRSSNANQSNSQRQRPAPSGDVQKAEQDLQEAARQLAQHRQQAEDNLALEFVRRFQAELGEMVQRQQTVIKDTVQLDAGRQPNKPLRDAERQAVARLVDEERQLATLARENGELLFGLSAVRLSLQEAERRLTTAGELLNDGNTGATVQQAERLALVRLEGMLEAFAQTANEAGQSPPSGAGASAPPGQQSQRGPTFELLELKMLRMLQVDLNQRTRIYHEQLNDVGGPPETNQKAELMRQAQDLQVEQGQLAELVQEMLNRDNEEGGE
jgi:hypothetical protein